ncbi:hypothetical protein ACFT9M_25270 [Micromonospora purpureochromogenes]|uniref:hypothetical protein n=1 Tax=Micromonospora purpureochromogenes TaxID=47872 RepID=UPI0036317EF1
MTRPALSRLLPPHPTRRFRENPAPAPGLPDDVIALLAADEDVHVPAALATWATLDPALAADLARHPHAEVRRGLALNPRTPPALLAALADGGMPAPRHCFGCLPHPDHRREEPCDGGHETAVAGIAYAVAENPATPGAAVVPLAAHPWTAVRAAVAARRDQPPRVYGALAADPIPGVRGALAENPAVGEEVIRELAADDGYDVRRCLAHNPAVPLDVLTGLAATTRIGPVLLPRVAAATDAEVRQLAAARVPAARMLVARRRDLPADVRDALAQDPDVKVVAAVADHAALTATQLAAMVARFGAKVATAVARNPGCPPDLLHRLAVDSPGGRRVFREITRHAATRADTLELCLAQPAARADVAAHPALPLPILAGLLDDPDPAVVEAAAANPALPASVMRRLLTPPAGNALPG